MDWYWKLISTLICHPVTFHWFPLLYHLSHRFSHVFFRLVCVHPCAGVSQKWNGLRNPRRHHAPHPPPLAAANPTRLFASCACMGGDCSLLFSHAPCWNCEMWTARKAVKVTTKLDESVGIPQPSATNGELHLETPWRKNVIVGTFQISP